METKPYQLICGSSDDVNTFEEKVASAMQQGYEMVDDLITQVVTKADGKIEIMFFQPMLFDNDDDYGIDEEEFAEEEDEEYLAAR